MTERHRAAVHVEFRFGDGELAAHALDAAERFVHLEEVDIVDRPAGLRETALDRALRRREETLGLVRELALRDDPRDRLRPDLTRPLLGRDDQRGAAIIELRRVARRDRAAGLERRLKLRQRFEGRLTRRLIFADQGDGAFLPCDLDGLDLQVERSLALRADRLLVRAEREAVLIFAAEPALLGDELTPEAHVPVAVCVHEAVDEIGVLELVLAERKAG